MFKRIGVCTILLLIFVCITVYSGMHSHPEVFSETHVDLVMINYLFDDDPNERAPVSFPHDLHTRRIKSEKVLNCRQCHMNVDKAFSTRFLDTPGSSNRRELMDAFHKGCIGCHTSDVNVSGTSGPVICSGCHINKKTDLPAARPVEFNKFLHFSHVENNNNKCDTCHHVYNKDTKILEYVKGKEGACFYCHQETRVDNRISLKEASHKSCVQCHALRISEEKPAGPVECSGCHTTEKQDASPGYTQVPRLKMNQPDKLMLKNSSDFNGAPSGSNIPFVPFDHQNHEMKNSGCKVCHHKELTSCIKCHTIEGSSEGGSVRLIQAMHSETSDRSCIGCHEKRTRTPECSGCHSLIWKSEPRTSESCSTCHVKAVLSGDDSADAAELLNKPSIMFNDKLLDGVPDIIKINILEKRYQPVDFPHRQIIVTLAEFIENNRLAGYFHYGTDTLCSGCHHSRPSSEKPQACSKCHDVNRSKTGMGKTSLYGAYHIQCMDCHKAMNIRQPETCKSCHKKKDM